MSKIVLITGASSGIGEATARILADAGMTVVLGARRTDRLERLRAEIADAGGTVCVRRVDVTDRDDVTAFAQAAVEEFGRIDVIDNNAGIMPLSPMSSLKVDEWERMVDVNIKGVLWGHSSGAADDERARCGPHHQHRFDWGSAGIADRSGLLRDQVRGSGDLGWAALRK